MNIGQLARESRVPIDTIRYYERLNLIPKAPRTEAGYRNFPSDVVPRLRFIKRSQELGFSLEEIRELLALKVDPQTTCAKVLHRATEKLSDIDRRVDDLLAMRRALEKITKSCTGRGPATACPILENLDSGALR